MGDSNKENMLKDLRSEFFNHILNWDPHWFWEKKYRNKIPDVINNIKMTAGKLHYNDVEEYQSVMFPQLIHEYWFTLQNDYKAFFAEKSHKKVEVEDPNIVSSLNQLVFTSSTRSNCCFGENKRECMHPRKGDLVELFVNRNKYFAYVKDKYVSRRDIGYTLITYTLLLGISSKKNLLYIQASLATITSITFLEGCLGMVEALSCLETFPLCKLILSPNAEQYRMPSQLKLNVSDITTGAHPNPSQLKVISGIVGAIELSEPRICLVQGPPGTGKSNTIVNLIASMIKRDTDIQFLVCAPSNKAVDSLALQLIKIQPILEYQNIPFKVVRVGNEEKIDGVVRNISLDILADELKKKIRWGSLTRAEEKEYVLMNSQVIASTLTSCYTNSCMRESPFNGRLVCIVDEAAQAHELWTIIPLLLGVKLLFLVGDHKQLEPIVLSQEAKRYGYNSSLFSRAQKIFKNEKKNPIAMLDTQYRMVEPISCWPNKYFYNSRLKDAAIVNPLGICNYMLFNHNFPQNPDGRANIKEAELVVKLIAFLRKKLNLKENGKITIGVITPYHDQRELIKNLLDSDENKFPRELQQSNKRIPKSRNCKIVIKEINKTIESSTKLFENLKLEEKLILESENSGDKEIIDTTPILAELSNNEKINETTPISVELFKNLKLDFGSNDHNDNDDNDDNTMIYKEIEISQELLDNLRLDFGFEVEKNKTIEVNTVDSFQGSERDIIIMSCVRSHELGFTKNPNRLNVSITRAKHTLIMFGNFEAFTGNRMWSSMIRDATKRNVLVEVNDSNTESVFNQHVSF